MLVSGESTAILEPGIEVVVSFLPEVGLPFGDSWFVRLREKKEWSPVDSMRDDKREVETKGEAVHFFLEKAGEWEVLLLRRRKIEDKGSQGETNRFYSFSNPDGSHSIKVKDTTDRQSFVLPVTAEGFASMLLPIPFNMIPR